MDTYEYIILIPQPSIFTTYMGKERETCIFHRSREVILYSGKRADFFIFIDIWHTFFLWTEGRYFCFNWYESRWFFSYMVQAIILFLLKPGPAGIFCLKKPRPPLLRSLIVAPLLYEWHSCIWQLHYNTITPAPPIYQPMSMIPLISGTNTIMYMYLYYYIHVAVIHLFV